MESPKPLIIFAVRDENSLRRLLPAIWEAVECSDPLLALVVARGIDKWKFHSCNFYSLSYLANGWSPHGQIHPCRDLQGRRVHVESAAIPDPDYAGEIVSIEIYK